MITVVLFVGSSTSTWAADEDTRWISGTHTLIVDGVEREFVLDIPKELRPGSALVWVFHGYTGSAASMRGSAGFTELFDGHGFVVVYPQGTTDSRGHAFFNVGYDFHRNQQIDDVRFVRQLTDRLVTDLKIDRRAIFATGMSNGGDMCFFLASREDPFVRAIAPVSGTMMQSWSDSFVPKTRIPVLAFHGTADSVTKWEGDLDNRDGWGSYLGVEAVLDLWTEGMSLESKSVTVVLQADDEGKSIELHRWTSASDRTEVRFYKILGGGHEWPTHLGDPQRSTATVIWDFFRSHLPANNALESRSDRR